MGSLQVRWPRREWLWSAELSPVLTPCAAVRVPLVTARVHGMCRIWPWPASATPCHGFLQRCQHLSAPASWVTAEPSRRRMCWRGVLWVPQDVSFLHRLLHHATGHSPQGRMGSVLRASSSQMPWGYLFSSLNLGSCAIASVAAMSCDQGNSAIA